MSQTRIFVSSTCYDLIHIRQALNEHIREMGHIPVMSEFGSFRVDPHNSAIENCRKNVRENADIFVLIVGGRRGSVDRESGKSIVNLEYEAAVGQGLDIYVFVEQSVLSLIPIWKSNPATDLSPVVDSTEVLAFIDRIRREQRWTFPFSKEADIFEILGTQISGQLRDLLAKNRSGNLSEIAQFQDETPTARALVAERPRFWEYSLTAELIERRIGRLKRSFDDVKCGRVLGPHQILTGKEFMTWLQGKFPELKGALDTAVGCMEIDVTESWGPAGQPGKPLEILCAVNSLERALQALVHIESDIFRTHGPDACEGVREALLGMSLDIFKPISESPNKLREAVRIGMEHKEGEPPITLNLEFKFEFSKGDELKLATEEMAKSMNLSDW